MLVIIIVITITIIVMIVTRVLDLGFRILCVFLMSEDRPIVEKDLYWKLVVFMCVCKCKFIES